MIHKVKGTQDFLDLSLFNFIVEAARKHLALYHFHEISTPVLEPTDLFKRSLGLQTDVVSKEMFLVTTEHHEEHESICLRPEATASTVRAFVENQVQQTPWKVFSHGPMFRHERPQKGRFREFHQINLEIIGAQSIANDAYVLTMLDRFFQEKLQLDTYALTINFLGCAADRAVFKEKLYQFLMSAADQICQTCIVRKEKNILRVFDCKIERCQELYRQGPRIVDYLCDSCKAEWNELQTMLELLSVPFSYKPTLVRGLDYYDKTVFEFVSLCLGAQNAFCSGGRYNHLVSQIGGKEDQPALGAAMGIERLILLLEPKKDKLPLPQPPKLITIAPLDPAQQTLALLLADQLQAHGLSVEVFLEGDSLKSMMRRANKLGASYCLVLGSQEQEKRQVMVKNMVEGTQEAVGQADLVNYFK